MNKRGEKAIEHTRGFIGPQGAGPMRMRLSVLYKVCLGQTSGQG